MSERTPERGECYKHFKGGIYLIDGIARHTETGEMFVIYHRLCGDPRIWARPLEMFTDMVNGQPRFERIYGR